MRVVTKLAQMEFRVGDIRREGDFLIMESDESQSMKVKAYIDAVDVARMFKSGMKPGVIGFLFGVPGRARKAKRTQKELREK